MQGEGRLLLSLTSKVSQHQTVSLCAQEVPEDQAKTALRSAIAALKLRLARSHSSPEQVDVQLTELQRVSLELEARIDLARPARCEFYSNCGEYFSVHWILLDH